MFVWLCLLCFAFTSTKATTASISLSTTTNNYITTSVSWGTPSQGPFTVLVDTTSTLSFVLSTDTSSTTDNQNTFDSSSSSTFSQPSTASFHYLYQNQTFDDGYIAKDTLTIAGYDLSSQDMGLAKENPDLFQNEDVSGILALDTESTISSNIEKVANTGSSTISILYDDKSIVFGDYSYTSINDSLLTIVSTTDDEYLKLDWVFAIDSIMIEDFSLFSSNTKVYGVIDTASPYITIYAPSYADFLTIWKNLDGSSSSTTSNCNITTRQCIDTSTIRSSITITSDNNYSDSFYITQSDFVIDGYLSIIFGGNKYTNSKNYVFFLGQPFLTTRVVQLNIETASITISSVSSSSSTSSNVIMVVIILGSVVCFALLFFAIYFWKNKLPPSGMPNTVAFEDGSGGNAQQLGGNIPYDQRQDAEQMRLLRNERFANNMNDGYGYGAYVEEPPSAPPSNIVEDQRVGSSNMNIGGSSNDEIRNRRLEFLRAREMEQQQRQIVGLDED